MFLNYNAKVQQFSETTKLIELMNVNCGKIIKNRMTKQLAILFFIIFLQLTFINSINLAVSENRSIFASELENKIFNQLKL